MGLALRVQDLDEDTLAASKVKTKVCSSCDPDIPGHCDRKACGVCRGTGREPLSFCVTFSEIVASKAEALKGPRKFGSSDDDYDADGDDMVQDLEY